MAKMKIGIPEWSRTIAPFEGVLLNYQMDNALKVLKGPRVLEVGCGDGTTTKILCRSFPDVVGIDSSRPAILEAITKCENAAFIHKAIEKFTPDKPFDSILMMDVLEHVRDPQALLNKAYSWLKPNGILVVQCPNAESLNRRIGLKMGLIKGLKTLDAAEKKKGHKHLFDIHDLNQMTAEAGFGWLSSGGFFLKPLPNAKMMRLVNDMEWQEGSGMSFCDALNEIGGELDDYANIIYVHSIKNPDYRMVKSALLSNKPLPLREIPTKPVRK